MDRKKAAVPIVGEEKSGEESPRRSTKRKNRQARRRSRKVQEESNRIPVDQHYHLSPIIAPSSGDIQQEPLARTRNPFAKEWDPMFSEDRDHRDDSSFVDARRMMFTRVRIEDPGGFEGEIEQQAIADENGISTFLCDFDEPMAVFQVDEVKEFCQGVSLKGLKSAEGTAGIERECWIDDRQFPNETNTWDVREHDNPLTATALHRALSEKRFDHGHLSNADRRLIYIRNLSPAYILALAETAPAHQVPALREAIGNHLSRITSIRVHIRTRQFSTFQLDLHIPYYELLEYSIGGIEKHKTPRETLSRASTNLSFLDMPLSKTSERKTYAIQKARFSLVICGSDDKHYVAYAFVDREFGEDEDLAIDFPYQGVHEDPIASDCGNHVIDANKPILDPRAYLLVMFELRMKKVLTEWSGIARIIGGRIDNYEDRYTAKLSRNSGSDTWNGKAAFDWNQQTMKLLGQLLHDLSETVEAWDVFRGPNGDSRYFDDVGTSSTERQQVLRSLRAIDDKFETLKGVRRNLVSFQGRCEKSANTLDLQLTLESNEAVRHTIFTTEWTIQVFSPIAITIACYSMPAPVLPPGKAAFFVTMLVMMFLVRLLLDLFGGRLQETWWWKSLAWFSRFWILDETTLQPAGKKAGHTLPSLAVRPNRLPDLSREGIELDGAQAV